MNKGKSKHKAKKTQQSKIKIKRQDLKNYLKFKRDENAVCTAIDKSKDNEKFKAI